MFIEGKLINKVITSSDNDYSLKGMINPTFQNTGETAVLIDGRKVLAGESFSINAPNVILQNKISIVFESEADKANILHVGYVETSVVIKTQDSI